MNFNQHLIFEYDAFRVAQFAQAGNACGSLEINDKQAHFFKGLDYFNYLLSATSFTQPDFINVQKFYLAKGIKRFKWITLEPNCSHQPFLTERFDLLEMNVSKSTEFHSDLDFSLLEPTHAPCYARLYLKGFKSISDPANPQVLTNFKKLLGHSNHKVWRVQLKGCSVGLCAMFSKKQEAFLSAGVVLKPFQKRGFHKEMIAFRLQQATKLGFSKLCSWAYADGISSLNLQQQGFKVCTTFYAHHFSSKA